MGQSQVSGNSSLLETAFQSEANSCCGNRSDPPRPMFFALSVFFVPLQKGISGCANLDETAIRGAIFASSAPFIFAATMRTRAIERGKKRKEREREEEQLCWKKNAKKKVVVEIAVFSANQSKKKPEIDTFVHILMPSKSLGRGLSVRYGYHGSAIRKG